MYNFPFFLGCFSRIFSSVFPYDKAIEFTEGGANTPLFFICIFYFRPTLNSLNG